jgi:hypothetical protein
MYSAADSATSGTEGKLITEMAAVIDITVTNDRICERKMS